MAVDIYMRYEGGLRCSAQHGPSRATLESDAPVDNHGRGEAFSPTDLLATGLGLCMLTTMGIVANQRGWKIDGIEAHVQKHMTTTLPRRVARLLATLSVPPDVASGLDSAARSELEHTAHTCPVRLSLHETIEVPVSFRWGSL